MPTIIAMETMPDNIIRDKAIKLHQHLHCKHSSLIYTRNIECIKKAFEYQRLLAGNALIRG